MCMKKSDFNIEVHVFFNKEKNMPSLLEGGRWNLEPI